MLNNHGSFVDLPCGFVVVGLLFLFFFDFFFLRLENAEEQSAHQCTIGCAVMPGRSDPAGTAGTSDLLPLQKTGNCTSEYTCQHQFIPEDPVLHDPDLNHCPAPQS